MVEVTLHYNEVKMILLCGGNLLHAFRQSCPILQARDADRDAAVCRPAGDVSGNDR